VGAGAAVLGGVLYGKAADAADAAKKATSRSDYNAATSDFDKSKGVMLGGFIGAGVFIAAGVVLIVLDQRGKEKSGGETDAVALRAAPGGIAVEF
jgi:predicted acyl esterase